MKIKYFLWVFIIGLVFCVGSVQAAIKLELPKPKTEAQIRKESIYKALEAKFQNGELEISSLGEWESFDFEAVLNLFLRDNSNQVKVLKISGCEITTINISPCDCLEICDLSDNKLREVIGLGATKKLKKLDLRWNSELKKLPKGLEDLEELIDFKIGFDDLLKSEKVIALAVFDTVRNKQKEGEIGERVKEAEVLEQKKLEETRIRKETERKKLEEELKKKAEVERLKREAEKARIKKENEEKEEKKQKADAQKKKQEDEARIKQELEDEQAAEALRKMLVEAAEDEQEESDDEEAEVLFVKDPLKIKIMDLSEAIGILSDRLKMLAKKMAEVKKSIG